MTLINNEKIKNKFIENQNIKQFLLENVMKEMEKIYR